MELFMKRSLAFFVLGLITTCSLCARSLQDYADNNTIKVIKYTEANVEKYDEGDLSTGAMGLADYMIDLSSIDLTDLNGISKLRVKDTDGTKTDITDIDKLLLYLEDNQLVELPVEIRDMKNVTVIFVKKNDLTELPEELTSLKNLKAIYADDNKIDEFPEIFFEFAQFSKPVLKKIGLSKNRIDSLPSNIGDLSTLPLYHLNLSENNIRTVPSSIGDLKQLRVLRLDGNALTQIPDEIGDLSGLINKLYLNDNYMTDLPISLAELPVEVMYLQNNNLLEVPAQFGKLEHLKEIYLSNNQLTTLPVELADIDSLKKIDVRDNPIQSIPSKLKNKSGLKILTN